MSKEMSAVIVDDEAHCQTALSGLLARHHPTIKLLGIASNLVEGVEAVSRLRPDILFLDVEIGNRTGFDLLQALGPSHPHVIFTTAHESYALKAIRFSALDFLLKPIDADELDTALDKARASTRLAPDSLRILSLLSNMLRLHDGRLSVPSDSGITEIPLASIVRIDHDGEKAWLHADGSEALPLAVNLKDCEDLLAEHGFIRVHRTAIINPSRILSQTSHTLTMTDGTVLNVDPRKQDQVRAARSI